MEDTNELLTNLRPYLMQIASVMDALPALTRELKNIVSKSDQRITGLEARIKELEKKLQPPAS